MTTEESNSERGSKLLKLLDRYIGIPFVFILGLISFFNRKILNKAKLPSDIKSIAILKTAAIGDTVLLTGIIKDLKANYPQSKIDFFCGSSNYALANLIKDCNEVTKLPLKNFKELKSILQKNNYDLVLDFGAWPRINAVCSFLINSKFKIGFKTEGQYRHYVYDKAVKHSDKLHELENYRNILRAVGLECVAKPTLPEGESIEKLLSQIEVSYVICHMWAGGEKSHLKEWPSKNWQKLMLEIIKNKKREIVLTGGKEDHDKNMDFIASFPLKNHIYNFAGIKLSETISILKGADLVISVNTGVMHMAASLGVKTISLNGPTSEIRWGPIGSKAISINSDLEGAGYLNLGFEYKDELKCMENIDLAKVLEKTNSLL